MCVDVSGSYAQCLKYCSNTQLSKTQYQCIDSISGHYMHQLLSEVMKDLNSSYIAMSGVVNWQIACTGQKRLTQRMVDTSGDCQR